MKTLELMQQLLQRLKSNPELCDQMDWQTLTQCISEDFSFYNILYSKKQFETLSQTLKEYCSMLLFSVADGDIKSIIHYLEYISAIFSFLPEYEEMANQIYEANFQKEALRHYKEKTMVVLGDSHVNFFSGNEQLTFLPIGEDFNICPQIRDPRYSVIHMGPCLAYTSDSKESTYSFQKKLSHLKKHFLIPGDSIIVSLGEIDLRVHVFKQTALQSVSYEQVVDSVLVHYENTLSQLVADGYKVSCFGPIASQTDACIKDSLFPRNGSEIERNQATRYFNTRLQAFCESNGLGFLTPFYNMVTSDNRTKEEYLSSDRCHLGQAAWQIMKTYC